MSGYEKRGEIEIAAMRKRETANYNVMLPGSGTPWEDRGGIGFIWAFFKTCFKSLFGHRALLDQIRRPETTSEATGFAIGCAAIWAVSTAIWDGFLYHRFNGNTVLMVNGQQYLIESALRVIGMFLLVVLFLKLATTIFVSLLSNTAQQQIPRVLVYNVLAYSLGPSILAIVPVLDICRVFLSPDSTAPGILLNLPFIGWALAGGWIMIDMLIGAKTRMYLRTREVVVDVIIIAVVLVVVFASIFFAFYYLWPAILGGASVRHMPPTDISRPMNG